MGPNAHGSTTAAMKVAVVVLLLFFTASAGCLGGDDDGDGEDGGGDSGPEGADQNPAEEWTDEFILITPDVTYTVTAETAGENDIETVGDLDALAPSDPGAAAFMYTSDQDVHSVSMDASISISDDGMSLEGRAPECLVVVQGETTMGVSPTVLEAAGVDHGLPFPSFAESDAGRVVVILLDGYGWRIHMDSRGLIDTHAIDSFPHKAPAATVYPPITNVATASILTGHPPADTGIRERKDHTLREPTFLDLCADAGLTTAFIEGSAGFLDAGMDLTVDLDGDGETDDDIRDKALGHVDRDVLMVHFHSIDDAGHAHGTLSEEHLGAISTVDGYVGDIVDALEERTLVILVADHGMHDAGDDADETEDDEGSGYGGREGVHGDYTADDMLSFLAWGEFGG